MKVVLATIVISILIIAGVIFSTQNQNNKTVDPGQLEPAKIQIDSRSVDLGNMNVEEEKTGIFKVKNISDKTLKIWNVQTSCDCTFVKVVINGKESPEFTMAMHMNANLSSWSGEVAPGEEAEIRAIYKPKIMPVSGKISRSVIFSTNDPENKKVDLVVSANVI